MWRGALSIDGLRRARQPDRDPSWVYEPTKFGRGESHQDVPVILVVDYPITAVWGV
jgi:hypothetical protein